MNHEEYKKRRNELMAAARAALSDGNMDTYNVSVKQVEELDDEYEAKSTAAANLRVLEGKAYNTVDGYAAAIGAVATETLNLSNHGMPGKHDLFDTVEYNQAFMEYVCRGTEIPKNLLRPNGMKNEAGPGTTVDGSAVIPTHLTTEIIREMKSYGALYAKVRKMNVQGGVEFPVLTLKPTASWIGETTPSKDQKIKADAKVSFSYFGLECKISQTLLASVVSMQEFESQFVQLSVEAIVEVLEKALFTGDGTGKMLGVLKDSRIPAANVVTMTAEEFGSYAAWKKKVFSKMRKSYRAGEFAMAQGSWDGYIDGMVDANGQPIGRVNYGISDGSGEAYRFCGKLVETVEDDVIANFDDAGTGDVVAVFWQPGNYAVNSNMQFTTVKWMDNDANEVKNKVMLICDGKLLDPYGVIVVKKAVKAEA